MRSPILIYATWPWSEDRRQNGAPIEFNIHTRRWYILVRPFSRSQAYKQGRWTDEMRHIAISPQNPDIWKQLRSQDNGR